MSIYYVKLAEWFPKGDKHFDTCLFIVKESLCPRCKRTPKYKAALGYHAVPWGYGGDIFCSSRCFKRRRR